MKELLNIKPLEDLMIQLKEIVPTIVGAILFFIVAWIVLKLVLFVVRKSLKLTKIDALTAKITENENFFSSSLRFKPTAIILAFVKWFLILVFLVLGSDLLGLSMVSNEVGKIINYLPKIFSAFIILGFGLYLASMIRSSSKRIIKSFHLSGSRLISLVLFYIIVAITGITALNQAGVNTEVITKNLSIILGAFLAAFAIALGLGTREIITRLVMGFYARKNFSLGQLVRINEFEGRIEAIDNICVTVVGASEKRIYPIRTITDKRIDLIEIGSK